MVSEVVAFRQEYGRSQALKEFRKIVGLRLAEEAEIEMKADGQAIFSISGTGTETVALSLSKKIKKGDIVRGYYRDAPLAIACGVIDVKQKLAGVLGNIWNDEDGEPFEPSGGRQMGNHIASKLRDKNGELADLDDRVIWLSGSSPTASQMPIAVGAATAQKLRRRQNPERDNVAVVTIGDASMAEGISWESVNQAVVQELPLVYVCYDNEFGISVPVSKQIAHSSVSEALQGLAPKPDTPNKGLKILGPVDGSDLQALDEANDQAFEWVRKYSQPAFVHVKITQPHGHSSSGHHARYKSDDRLRYERENDPIMRMRETLISGGEATEQELDSIIREEIIVIDQVKVAAWKDFYTPVKTLGENALEGVAAFGLDLESYAEALDINGVDREPVVEILQSTSEQIQKAIGVFQNIKKSGEVLRVSKLHEWLRKLLVETNNPTLKKLEGRKNLARMVLDIEKEMDFRINGNVYATGERSPLRVPMVLPQYTARDGQLTEDKTNVLLSVGYRHLMEQFPNLLMFGEDLADAGGVAGATAGLVKGLIHAVSGDLRTIRQTAPTLRNLDTFKVNGEKHPNPLLDLVNLSIAEVKFKLPKAIVEEKELYDRNKLVVYLRGLVNREAIPGGVGDEGLVELILTKEDVLVQAFANNPSIKKYFASEGEMLSAFRGFGETRVWDSSIAEATIVGQSIALAMLGFRTIGEIQYVDYMLFALQQLVDEGARLRHSTRGAQISPFGIKTLAHQLLGLCHSGSPMMKLIEAGLRVICGRSAVEIIGMTRAFLKGDDPALILEPLFRVTGGKEPLPDNFEEVCIPLGHSDVMKKGSDLTLVTYGECCYSAMDAAMELEEKFGISVEVIDIRCLNPVDINNVAKNSIRKTGRLLVLDEDIPGGASSYLYNKLMLADMPDGEGGVTGEKVINYTEVSDCLTGPECKPAYAGFEGRYWTKPNQYKIVDKALAMMKQAPGMLDPATLDIYGLK